MEMTSLQFNNISVPCNHCENRSLGCHSKCELYINYRASVDQFNASRNKDREDNRELPLNTYKCRHQYNRNRAY